MERVMSDPNTMSPEVAPPMVADQAAWEKLKGRIMAQAPEVPKRRSADQAQTARRVLMRADLLDPERDALGSLFVTNHRAKLFDALTDLRSGAQALFYVAAQYANAPTTPKDLVAKIKTAQKLRKAGMHWVEALQRGGHIPSGTTEKLRAGTGHNDTASDLVVMGPLLVAHWDKIKAVAAPALTAEQVAGMGQAGSELLAALAGADAPASTKAASPWLAELCAADAFCEQQYEFLRPHAALHFSLTGRPDLVAAFSSYRGLTHLGVPKPKKI
jgi:hypothetical protein